MPESSQRSDSQDPTQFVGNSQSTDAEKRRLIEESIGAAVDDCFEKNAAYVKQDEAGIQHLELYLPREKRETATLSISQVVDAETGNRVVKMGFKAKDAWETGMIYTDGPELSPTLIAASGGNKNSDLQPLPADHYNNQDHEIAFWGKLWPNNLSAGSPERPKLTSRIKSIGRRAIKQARGY